MDQITIDLLIAVNKGVISEGLEKHDSDFEGIGVQKDELEKILSTAQKQNHIIMKVAYLMAGIAWAQPFSGGNKRTAITISDTFLRLNGARLVISSNQDIEYLRKLLFEIQENRHELDEDTLAKIILYVSKRIEKL